MLGELLGRLRGAQAADGFRWTSFSHGQYSSNRYTLLRATPSRLAISVGAMPSAFRAGPEQRRSLMKWPRRDPVNGSIPITMDRNTFRKARADARWQGIKIGLGWAVILVAADLLWRWLR